MDPAPCGGSCAIFVARLFCFGSYHSLTMMIGCPCPQTIASANLCCTYALELKMLLSVTAGHVVVRLGNW